MCHWVPKRRCAEGNKKLSYRREAARCLVLISILVSRWLVALSRMINMVTFANLRFVRLRSLKFVGLRVRKIRRI